MSMPPLCSIADDPRPYQSGPMVRARNLTVETWSANAEGSNVTPAWCWQMYPFEQSQEKQQGPFWCTAAPAQRPFSLPVKMWIITLHFHLPFPISYSLFTALAASASVFTGQSWWWMGNTFAMCHKLITHKPTDNQFSIISNSFQTFFYFCLF